MVTQLVDGMPVFQDSDVPFANSDVFFTSDLMTGYAVTERGFQLRDAMYSRPVDISKFRNLQDVELMRLFNWPLSRCNVTDATATE